RRRRSSASWKNSAGGIGVFHQIREVFFRPSLNELAPVLLVAEALNDVAEEQTRLDLIRALDLPEDTSYEEAVAAAFSDAFDEALETIGKTSGNIIGVVEENLVVADSSFSM
ncbi:hypothetical protein ACI2KR_28905, partial [Pseudomonas luteola]